MGWVRNALRRATWAKVSYEEANRLSPGLATSHRQLAGQILADYALEMLVVTLGAEGALGMTANQWHECPTTKLEHLVDPVGAGDAFDAVVIMGLTRGWGLASILRRATQFGAAVCGIRGATLADRSFYDSTL